MLIRFLRCLPFLSLFLIHEVGARPHEDILKKFHMKLGGRRGEMIKVFDIFVDAAKKGDVLAMDSIFHVSTAHLSGFYLSSYKFDLFEIFKTNPKFFLERGKIFFKDKGTCNMYWPYSSPFQKILKTLKQRLSQEEVLDTFLIPLELLSN